MATRSSPGVCRFATLSPLVRQSNLKPRSLSFPFPFLSCPWSEVEASAFCDSGFGFFSSCLFVFVFFCPHPLLLFPSLGCSHLWLPLWPSLSRSRHFKVQVFVLTTCTFWSLPLSDLLQPMLLYSTHRGLGNLWPFSCLDGEFKTL